MSQTQTKLAVLDKEIFDEIREAYKTQGFIFVKGKYDLEGELLKKVLGFHNYQELVDWCDGKTL